MGDATRLTGGEAIVRSLEAHGVSTVFGLPGVQIYGLFDALQRAAPGISVIGARHEQACAYMAYGYARSTGRPGVFAVVPGPGMLNAAAGLLTALGNNVKVLCLTGQTPSEFLGQGRGHLHEMPDQLGTLRGFVKWAERIEHPGQVPDLVARAFRAMAAGRPGPAALEMPWDVFTQSAPVGSPTVLPPWLPPPADPELADRIALLIRDSRAPMIFVGSGAIHAADAVAELAARIEAPVVGFRGGRGIVGDDRPLGLTIAAGYELWPETDLAIGIGTRMEIARWNWPFRPSGLKVVRIDIDPAELRRDTVDVGMIADARAGTEALLDALRRHGVSRSGRSARIAAAKAKAAAEIQAIQPQLDYLAVVRAALPRDGILASEVSQVGFAAQYGFPVYVPRTYLSAGHQGTLGAGFPSALGAKVAHRDKPVVSICGDGGFMFAVEELSTAVQYGIGVVTLVFNNSAYGNVRRDQIERFGGRLIGADLVNPDFLKLADAFGVAGARVASPAALQPVLEQALADGGPWLIEVQGPRGGESSPWRFITPPLPPEG